MKRTLFAATLTALAIAAPASAQVWRGDSARGGYADSRYSYIEARRAAYDNGYREGLKEGQKESRNRDGFDYRDERTYQRADKGYHREFGDRERYRQMFRSGYADGYAEAYRRLGYRGQPGRGIGRGRQDGRNVPWYGRGAGGYGYGYNDAAFQNGARDGYEKGVEDANKRRSHDVLRHKWYRDGDRHFENRYGSRQQYEDVYRQGFRQGYEQGYRGGGRYR
jgi:flagellar biosynthesis/type III secretory pathway protein FliH